MSKTRLWSSLLLIVGLMAAVLVAGCGDDDGGSTDSTTTESSTSGITSVADLGGKIVGAQDGTTGETYANDETDAAEVRGFPEGPDAIAALQTGQVDAVIIDQPVAVDAIDKQGGGGFEIVEEITTDELYGYAMSPDSPNLRAEVNGALAELKEDGTITELYQQYFKTDPPTTVLDGINDLADPADGSGDPELINAGKLTVGTDTPFPPFEIGKPPDISGYDIDVLNAVADKLGLEAEYTDTSFETIFRDVANGQFDIVAAASTITPGREKAVDFSDPYYEAQQALLVKTGG